MIAGTDIVGRRCRRVADKNPRVFPFTVAAVGFGVGTSFVLMVELDDGTIQADCYNAFALEPHRK